MTRKTMRSCALYRATLAVLVALAAPCLPAQPLPAADPAVEPNPLLVEWTTPFGVPPFTAIRPEHFPAALTEAMAAQAKEIASITANPAPASFDNTLEALDDSGQLLDKVDAVFRNLCSAETNDQLQAFQREFAPKLAAHRDEIRLDAALFARIEAVWDSRATLELNVEQSRLLEETYSDFVRSGALLGPEQKTRMTAINRELAGLAVKFSDNVLKQTNAYKLVLDSKEQLVGLPERVIAVGAEAAKAAGLEDKWVYTLHAPSIWPFLENSADRSLRKRILDAYLTRGDHGDEFDNNRVIARIAALRVEKARLLGYPTFADFQLERSMAKNPAGVNDLLDRVWPPALAMARRELADIQAMVDAENGGFEVQAADWSYYAERARKTKCDLDDAELRPYFQLDNVRDGAFYVANRLYGLTFAERPDLPVYNSEVRGYEVKESDGSHVGIIYLDFFPRPGKRGGAWSSAYRCQWIRDGVNVTPVVVNVCNFSRPAGSTPALLSLDEVETAFHEFGHGLHQLLSRCRYRSLAGWAVPRDFVELPSQIMENWAKEPDVLKVYARHWQTGEPIPDALIAKMRKAEQFNQGFATVEYVAAAKLDMDWHTLTEPKEVDTRAFEKASLERMGLIPEIPPRYHSTYFNHIVGAYAAGYYSYLWSEVLDADAFGAFKEKGLFDQATAKSFRDNILARGGSEDAMTLYVRFRGRGPKVEPLLAKRGLL
jgi:peptidyl-dipeptidase Dcp